MSLITADLAPFVPLSFREGGRADGALRPGITEAKAAEVAAGIQARAKELPPTATGLFMALVDAADIAPNGEIPDDIGASLDKLQQAAGLIASLSVSSNDLGFLARALLEQTAAQRHAALEQRVTAREAAAAQLTVQAQELTDQAKNMMDGAIAAVVLSVAAAAIQVVGSGFALGNAKGSLAAVKAGNDQLGASLSSLSQVQSSITGGVSQGMSAAGGVAKGSTDSLGKTNEAEGAQASAEAQKLSNMGDMAKEVQSALDDMVRAIINFLKELADAKSQQMQAFTRV